MKLKISITSLFLLLSFSFFGQNLVVNPSFESFDFCPWEFSQFFAVDDWIAPTRGTSDYYNACEYETFPKTVKTPQNFFGTQEPYDGNAYVGIFTYFNNDYREYVLGRFSAPLKQDSTYQLVFQVSLADSAALSINQMGVYFTDSVFYIKNTLPLQVPYLPIYASDSSFLDNYNEWTSLKLNYTAKGGEKYLIIGNFSNNKQTATKAITEYTNMEGRNASYYYLDEICVSQILPDGTTFCINQGEPQIVSTENYVELEEVVSEASIADRPQVGEVVILKNVYFDFDKANLRPESYQELDLLYELLSVYPDMEIVLKGHTDSEGNAKYNQLLSESRALAVYAYLVKKGIDSSRLDFKGFGKMKPIATNETEEGRQENRRVEFEVIR